MPVQKIHAWVGPRDTLCGITGYETANLIQHTTLKVDCPMCLRGLLILGKTEDVHDVDPQEVKAYNAKPKSMKPPFETPYRFAVVSEEETPVAEEELDAVTEEVVAEIVPKPIIEEVPVVETPEEVEEKVPVVEENMTMEDLEKQIAVEDVIKTIDAIVVEEIPEVVEETPEVVPVVEIQEVEPEIIEEIEIEPKAQKSTKKSKK